MRINVLGARFSVPPQPCTTSAVYCRPAPILTTVTMAIAGVEESMPDHAVPDPQLVPVRSILTLLSQQPVLLAVTLIHSVADEQYDITVSKAVDDTGRVQPGFWWDVDRLARDERGQVRRERSWGRGRRAYETAEAAYLAAVHWVKRHEHSG
jgi:hypothetical protein